MSLYSLLRTTVGKIDFCLYFYCKNITFFRKSINGNLNAFNQNLLICNYYPQQTNAGTENQTSHVLTYKWELNDENTWTHGGEHHILESVEGVGRGRASGRIANGCWA